MSDAAELRRIHTFYVETDAGLEAAFVIDGRDFTTPEDLRAAINEACNTLDELDILAEYETESIAADAPPSWLPSWTEVKPDFLARRGSAGS